MVVECSEFGRVDRQWQVADGRMGKTHFGGARTGRNPTGRDKLGTKINLLTEASRGPLSILVTGANVHLGAPRLCEGLINN